MAKLVVASVSIVLSAIMFGCSTGVRHEKYVSYSDDELCYAATRLKAEDAVTYQKELQARGLDYTNCLAASVSFGSGSPDTSETHDHDVTTTDCVISGNTMRCQSY